MPEKTLKDIIDRLNNAKNKDKEFFGKVIFHVANNKVVSVEVELDIKEQYKKVLT